MNLPDTLTVIMLNTQRTYIAIVHENEHIPYGRRTIHVELTTEQIEKLRPKCVGSNGGKVVLEEVGEVFLETLRGEVGDV